MVINVEKLKDSAHLFNVSIEELQQQYDTIYALYKEKAGVLNLAVPTDNFPLVREVASDLSYLSSFLLQIQVIMDSKKRLSDEKAIKEVE